MYRIHQTHLNGKRPACRPRAMTLLEIVVVIAIIGILVALLLPAVQYSREAARRMTCASQLRQVAMGMHSHEALQRHLPSGGWGWRWTGEPDRGFGAEQPGGWAFNVLPFLEQDELRKAGSWIGNPDRASILSTSASVPVSVFNCPSRRAGTTLAFVHPVDYANMSRPQVVARSDYAACSGDLAPDVSGGRGRGPVSLPEGDSPWYVWHELDRSGVVYRRSTVSLGAISDGTTNTYLVGEKYLAQNNYYTGTAENDDQHHFVGYDSDTLRTTDLRYPPIADRLNVTSDHSFGSAHPTGFNMAMADGSVAFISYAVHLEVHRRRGNRFDGGVVQANP